MVHVNVEDLYKREYVILWSLLAFKAGIINAAGFLIAGYYVSHVTGFGTQIGVAIGHHEIDLGIELLIIPFAFIMGSFLTSLILDRDYSPNKIPNYPLVQFLITFILGMIALLFSSGTFDTSFVLSQDGEKIVLIGLLCLVCGLKNGLTTWATHGKIRTTHLTGLSTDIGLHMPKLFRSESATSRYPETKRVNYVRLMTFFSFSFGSCIAGALVPAIGYKIFYLTFAISVLFLTISILHRQRLLQANILDRQSIGETYANTH